MEMNERGKGSVDVSLCLEQRRFKKPKLWESCHVAQASRKLKMLLPQSHKSWNDRRVPPLLPSNTASAGIWILIAWICGSGSGGHRQVTVITLKIRTRQILISLLKQKYSTSDWWMTLGPCKNRAQCWVPVIVSVERILPLQIWPWRKDRSSSLLNV